MKAMFKTLHQADFTPDVMQEVINLGIKSGTWQEADRDYYKEQFLNPRNINIVYQDEDNFVVGYILAKPHNEAVQDYIVEDPAMKKNEREMFYVDFVIVGESSSGRSLGLALIAELINESHRRGVERFSMHCRVINGLSKIVQRKYGSGLETKRRIDHYVDCNDEPFDFMEIVVPF